MSIAEAKLDFLSEEGRSLSSSLNAGVFLRSAIAVSNLIDHIQIYIDQLQL